MLYVGLLCLAAATTAAAVLPMARVRRVLRPLAHVDRLTRLPEYARVYRVYFFSVLVTGVLLLVTLLTALTAGARPTGLSSSRQALDTAYPEDVMLCVGQPVSDAATASFLRYFAAYTQRLKPQDSIRIGLTSTTLRVIPLTRDHRYAADRLGSLAGLAQIRQEVDAREAVSEADRARLDTGTEEFSRPVTYVDYAPTVNDVLALCMTGFPSHEAVSGHRRQLIYLGSSTLRDPSDHRRSLFSDESLKQLAGQKGVQVNAIARSDNVASSTTDNDRLRATVEASGGKFFSYNPAGAANSDPAGTPGPGSGTDPTLSHYLDRIRADPPEVKLSGGEVVASSSVDSPETVLIASIAAAGLLCLSLAVQRR